MTESLSHDLDTIRDYCDSCGLLLQAAIVYSLAETAKANGIEPYEYLMLLLSMLLYLGKIPAHEELEKLML